MRFGYHNDILALAPTLVAGVIWCRGVVNSGSSDAIDGLLARSIGLVGERFTETADVARHPAISGWREVYSKLGLTPNRYPCAAESLIRRVVTGNPIPRISPLVDLCNAISMDHAIPVAPFDLRHVQGDCIVRRATGEEVFRAIGSSELQSIPAGEAIYADETPEVLSRRWNWRQTGKGAIRPDSTGILITTEAVHTPGRATVENVLDQLVAVASVHLRGSYETAILTVDKRFSETSLVG